MKIALVGQPEYFRFCYENDLAELGEVREFPFHFGMKASDFDDLVKFSADFNFFFRGEWFPPEALKGISGLKVALSSEPFPRRINGKLEYTGDSINRYLDFRSRIRATEFDYVLHYDEASLEFMKEDGLLVSGSFPFPVATRTYHDRQLSKEWDMFFIGRSTTHREKYFGHLKHEYNFLHICHGVWGPELVNYMCSAKICLNVHAEDEVSWEPRMQMMLSCGVFVISEKITPNGILRPGVDYVQIGSPSELYQAVKFYLHHDDERRKIARSGAERIRQMLDAQTNFLRLIEDINDQKYNRFRVGRGATLWNGIEKGRNAWTCVKTGLRLMVGG